MTALLAFIGFALLVVFHELGHFVAAKAVGMRVERFALFFPPLIAKVRRGETEYAIGAIPLGGYVKITGMNPEEELEPELRARSYSGSPVWKRVVVIAAGPVVNLVIAFALLTGIFWSEGKPVQDLRVAAVEQGQPADGKLREGDRILGARAEGGAALPGYAPGLEADELTERIDAIVGLIGRAGCGKATECATPAPVVVAVERDGARRDVRIVPAYDPDLQRSRVGVAFGRGDERKEIGPAEAAGAALTGMWDVTTLTVSTISRVIYDSEARKDTGSVVGGFEATRQSLEIDVVQGLWILAFISLSLAIINLFPFLPLDGGHIFWAVVEKLRGGRPVSVAVLERASIVGFMLVMALFFLGLSNDINRITSGEGFGIR